MNHVFIIGKDYDLFVELDFKIESWLRSMAIIEKKVVRVNSKASC